MEDGTEGDNFHKLRQSSPGGGIGRRAGFRCLWPQGRGSSSLLLGTKFLICWKEIG
jgi:hypothetical protein